MYVIVNSITSLLIILLCFKHYKTNQYSHLTNEPDIVSTQRGVRTGMAGTALTGPIFQRAQSKILALYMHTIIIFSASYDPNGARNGIIDEG